jgi:hypothetical protein
MSALTSRPSSLVTLPPAALTQEACKDRIAARAVSGESVADPEHEKQGYQAYASAKELILSTLPGAFFTGANWADLSTSTKETCKQE